MSKPLTMTEAQEFDLRDKASRLHDWPTFGLATQRVVMNVLAEVDALRAALAAAEARLADERRQLTAALEAERLHADVLAAELALYAPHGTHVTAHAARRAHDSECESEFDSQVHAQTPCGCAARRAAAAPLSDAGASSEVANETA